MRETAIKGRIGMTVAGEIEKGRMIGVREEVKIGEEIEIETREMDIEEVVMKEIMAVEGITASRSRMWIEKARLKPVSRKRRRSVSQN